MRRAGRVQALEFCLSSKKEIDMPNPFLRLMSFSHSLFFGAVIVLVLWATVCSVIFGWNDPSAGEGSRGKPSPIWTLRLKPSEIEAAKAHVAARDDRRGASGEHALFVPGLNPRGGNDVSGRENFAANDLDNATGENALSAAAVSLGKSVSGLSAQAGAAPSGSDIVVSNDAVQATGENMLFGAAVNSRLMPVNYAVLRAALSSSNASTTAGLNGTAGENTTPPQTVVDALTPASSSPGLAISGKGRSVKFADAFAQPAAPADATDGAVVSGLDFAQPVDIPEASTWELLVAGAALLIARRRWVKWMAR